MKNKIDADIAKSNLSVLLGNNLDKIKAVHYLDSEQIEAILNDLYLRPEQLSFTDCNKIHITYSLPVTGEDVALRILDAGKYPPSLVMKLVNYLKNFNRYNGNLGNNFINIHLINYPEVCDLLISEWAKTLTSSKKRFLPVPIFGQNPGLIVSHQDKYYETMITLTKDLNQLEWLIESFLNLLTTEDQVSVMPNLLLTVQQIVKNQTSQKIKSFKKLDYIDPNFPNEKEIANQLIYEAIRGLTNES